jgi:hypothetical protein
VLGHRYGCDPRTIRTYKRRMIAERPDYFDKLRLPGRLPRDRAFAAAKQYAEHARVSIIAAAEAAFT